MRGAQVEALARNAEIRIRQPRAPLAELGAQIAALALGVLLWSFQSQPRSRSISDLMLTGPIKADLAFQSQPRSRSISDNARATRTADNGKFQSQPRSRSISDCGMPRKA